MRILVITIGLGLLFSAPLLAQTPPPSSTPLDPVSWVLLGAAGIIGGKKYHDAKWRNNGK